MRDNQAMADKGAFGNACRIEGQALEGVDQFSISAGGDSEDELRLVPALISQRAQRLCRLGQQGTLLARSRSS